MNVCMFLMTEFTHDARVTKEARTLIQAGHKISVIALKSKNTLSFEKREDFEIKRVNVLLRYILPKGPVFFFLKYIEFVLQSVFQVINKPFDVYHCHDLETLPIGYILSRINSKPLIYDSHELYVDTAQQVPATRKVWFMIEKLLAPRTYTTIMENESRAEIFVKRYHVEKPIVLMNCQYQNIKKRQTFLRQKYNIPKEFKIIIYQGLISQVRGVDVLIETMKWLDNIYLFIVGPGDYKDTLKQLCVNHPKRNQIFILDQVPLEELSAITASADLGVSLLKNSCLNNYYALSNKIFEYLAAGLPVVFSDFPEMRKVIVDNHVGSVVNETDSVHIANEIKNILFNDKLYQEMSKNAEKIIAKKYNWEIESRKLLKLYSEI